MNQSLVISGVNLIYFYSLCLYAFFLPTFNNFTPLLLIILLVLTVADYKSIKRFWLEEKRSVITMGLPMVFILSSISLFYSSNLDEGIKLIFRNLPLLLTPLVLFKVSYLDKKQLNVIYSFFVIGCIITIFYSFSLVIYEAIDGSYKKVHLPKNYLRYFLNRITYHDLVSQNIVDHSIYFGAYVLLAIVLLKVKNNLFKNSIRKGFLFIFFITLILLTPVVIAISGLIIFTLIHILQNENIKTKANMYKLLKVNAFWAFLVFYLFVWKMQPHLEYIYIFNNIKYNVLIIGGVLVTIIIGQVAYQVYQYKLIEKSIIWGFVLITIGTFILILYPFDLDTFKLSNYTARLVNNYSSIQILKNNFFLGVGVGDIQDSLVNIYRELRFRKINYNEHNQYFRFWLGSGVLTFLIYLVWIVKLLLKSIQRKDFILIYVAVTFSLFCFTESVLARQMGICFFVFFVFYIYYSFRDDTKFEND